jgi:hypothetical protein
MDLSLTPASVLAASAMVKGWLLKEGATNTAFQKRWFLLWRHPSLSSGPYNLLYYESDTSTDAKGVATIEPGEFSVAPPKTARKKHPEALRFETSERKYILASEDSSEIGREADMKKWKAAFKRVDRSCRSDDPAAVSYISTRRLDITASVESSSAVVGSLPVNTVVQAIEECRYLGSIDRIRMYRGWISNQKSGLDGYGLHRMTHRLQQLLKPKKHETIAALERASANLLSTTAVLSGWLRSDDAFSWKRRWFVLWRHPAKDTGAFYLLAYEGSRSRTPEEITALNKGKFDVGTPKKARKEYPHCFRVDCDRKIVLAAEDEEELREWVEELGMIRDGAVSPTLATLQERWGGQVEAASDLRVSVASEASSETSSTAEAGAEDELAPELEAVIDSLHPLTCPQAGGKLAAVEGELAALATQAEEADAEVSEARRKKAEAEAEWDEALATATPEEAKKLAADRAAAGRAAARAARQAKMKARQAGEVAEAVDTLRACTPSAPER